MEMILSTEMLVLQHLILIYEEEVVTMRVQQLDFTQLSRLEQLI